MTTIFSAPAPRNIVNIINNSSVLYLSALAAAIGFRMNLFNIGVEGQYRVAVFAAAAFAGAGLAAGPAQRRRRVRASRSSAVRCGPAIAGVLKVTRGVSEVISTIMLNAIAVSLTAYLLRKWGRRRRQQHPDQGRARGLVGPRHHLIPGAPNEVSGWRSSRSLAGVGYWVLLNRTRFGFELRATGSSATAAVASGINVRRMVVVAMIISGGIAGLVGLPLLFGDAHSYGTTFQSGLGFAGIAVALLGRNNPVGIAFGALLFAFLSSRAACWRSTQASPTTSSRSPRACSCSASSIAYEVVRRYRQAAEQRSVAEQLAPAGTTQEVAA